MLHRFFLGNRHYKANFSLGEAIFYNKVRKTKDCFTEKPGQAVG